MAENVRPFRKAGCALAGLLLTTASALAADMTGEWWIEGRFGRVRIENCNNRMWGLISWEQASGAVDYNNPDPAKRNRPTLGMPILLGMQQTAANRWDGEVYSPEDGKTWTVNISLTNPDQLRIQGCLLFFCGGQVWARAPVGPKANAAADAAAPKQAAAQPTKPLPKGANGPPKAAPFETAKDVCNAVSAANRS
jgi:uncharacterized protein (DUF2147 family)